MKRLALLPFLLATSAFAQGEPKAEEAQTYTLKLRAAGPPVPSFRYELVPSFRNQTSNNAALLQHRALHFLADRRASGKKVAENFEHFSKALKLPLNEFPVDEVRNYLEPYKPVFREMEAAARCDRCDWGIDERIASDGISILLPDAQKMRELSFLLALRCRLHAAEDRVAPAIKDLETGFALARHASSGGTLIHFLIGVAIVNQCFASLEYVLQMPDCPNLFWSLSALPRPLLDFKKGIEGEMRSLEGMIPVPKDVDKGVLSEEAALVALDRFWADLAKFSENPLPKVGADSRMSMAFFITMEHPRSRTSLLAAGKTEAEVNAMPAAQIVLLDALNKFRTARDEAYVWFNLPYSEAKEGMKKFVKDERIVREGVFDYLKLVVPLMIPPFQRTFDSQYRVERRVASLRTIEAIRLHAAKNDGKLPAKLSDISLVPVPIDPVTNRPFEYLVEGNQFTLVVPPLPGRKPDQSGDNWKHVITLVK